MKKHTSTIITLYLCFVTLYFFRGAIECDNRIWFDLTKALPVLFLGISTWILGEKKLLPTAMILSAGGDIAGEEGCFLLQIALFAVAHICFILSFIPKTQFSRRAVIASIIWSCAVIALAVTIIPHIDSTIIRAACIVYMIIIGSMVTTTLFMKVKTVPLYIGAALIFVFSDSCIAWNRFVEPFDNAAIIIMATYFLAQGIFATLYIEEQ